MSFYLYICNACEQGGITCIQVQEVIDACLIILFNLLHVWKFVLVSISENWTTVRHTVGTLIFLCQRNPRMGKLVMMGNINKKKTQEMKATRLGWDEKMRFAWSQPHLVSGGWTDGNGFVAAGDKGRGHPIPGLCVG